MFQGAGESVQSATYTFTVEYQNVYVCLLHVMNRSSLLSEGITRYSTVYITYPGILSNCFFLGTW